MAAGDALGATVEFMSPVEIVQQYGIHREIIGGGHFGWRPGQGTDDTDLTWAVLCGYLDADDGDLLQSIARRFLSWFGQSLDERPRDVGCTTSGALLRLQASGDPTTSGLTGEDSCGNGSLMRALPTALIRVDAEQRRTESAQISAITHAHPRCVDSCIAYTEIAAALIDGARPEDAVAAAQALELDPQVRAALDAPADTPVSQLPTGGYVIGSLRCAVWSIQQPGSLEELLVALVNRGDDADTTAAIAGGLLGIIHGEAGIPSRWKDRLEYAQDMIEAAARMEAIRDR